jgi:hypothetical protein
MPMNSNTLSTLDQEHELWERVQGEYREMPGLQLTVAQASRLWNIDITASQAVLDALVDTAFLQRDGSYYVRAGCGRWSA